MHPWLRRHQRTTFLVASGLSTAGSFAGITAKGWILIHGSDNPLVLALHFGALALPSLAVSGPAGVLTDRLGSEAMLIKAQWGLFGAAVLGAVAIPLTAGQLQVGLLLLSTLLIGIASTFELTARSKYCALLVDEPAQLAPYLASFSVVFNVGKLVGPPLGGWLLALSGPTTALALDAASYLLPIATIVWLLLPNRGAEQTSLNDGKPRSEANLRAAWDGCGAVLRHVLRFTALACLAVFFHPGLAPLMARQVLDGSPQALGTFTAVLAAGSICGGLVLQRNSRWLSSRPGLLLGGCTLITGVAQVGLGTTRGAAAGLVMTFVIGAGTASLLAGANLITQVGAPQRLRGRMAGLSQIAFLGGGGLSGLLAAVVTLTWGLGACLALLGSVGIALGSLELLRRGSMRLSEPRAVA
ncbi:MAG: MFS transporter [Synechococcaceae bacterium WB9_2_112]|nr:MFS transporter [Synechococcaceae bacterium WB9_2_112]